MVLLSPYVVSRMTARVNYKRDVLKSFAMLLESGQWT